MSRLLVTGAAGFIGSHLTEALLRRGDTVVGLDNFDGYYDPALKRANVAAIQRSGGAFELVEGDIRDSSLREKMLPLGPFDAMLHLAGLAGVRNSIERPALYADVNVRGTAQMLELARALDIPRFVCASSSSVYGERTGGLLRESDPASRPLSPYAATKQAAEGLCFAAHHTQGLHVTALRYFSVYGPRQRPDMAISLFADCLRRGAPLPIFGDGTSARDYTYISDIVAATVSALDACRGFHVYNVGTGHAVQLSELVTLLGRALNVAPMLAPRPAASGDASFTCADITLARTELRWEPRITIEQGLRAFVAAGVKLRS